jgi:hypothetical protein
LYVEAVRKMMLSSAELLGLDKGKRERENARKGRKKKYRCETKFSRTFAFLSRIFALKNKGGVCY